MVVSGGFVGIVYGVVLCIMNNRPRTYIMWLLSFLLTVAQATVIYLIGDYAAVRLQSVLVWLIEHPIVFLLSLTTVAWLGRLSSSKAAGTEIPPEEQNLSGC
jgi:ABC-type dipeptide/oligopeptide/nickel transport system permease subunit